MATTALPVPVPQICSQRSPSNSSLEGSTPPSPANHTRMGDDGNSAPRTHHGRQRLRPWLIGLIDSGTVKGLEWMNKEKTLFKIPWKHAGKQDYNPEEDSKIFKLWSTNTGKYKEGVHVPEPAVWKTRLRTALNKLPDIEEIQEKTQLDIPEPYRVYKLLPKKRKFPANGVNRHRTKSDGYGQDDVRGQYQVPQMSLSAPPYQRNYDLYNIYGRQNHYGEMPAYDYNNYPQHPQYRRDLTTVPGPLEITLTDVDQVIQHNDQPSPTSTQYGHDITSLYQNHPRDTDVVGDDTASKIANAILHNNNDPAHTNYHDLVPSSTTAENMAYPATTRPYTGYTQMRNHHEPMYNTTCAPGTIPTTTMTNGDHRLEETPMEACQSGNRQSPLDELPSEQSMTIQVCYQSLNALTRQVDNPSGCMLYSKQPWDDGLHRGMEAIHLPDISDLCDPQTPGIGRAIELTNEVLRCFEKGISIQCKNGGDIYVTRRCRSVVFWSVASNRGQRHREEKLEREEEVKVFDLQDFRENLRQYLRGEKESPPVPEIYFTVAQKWSGEASLHSCLVSIVLTPARAAVELRSINHDIRTPPKSVHSGLLYFSGPDVPTPPSHPFPAAAEWTSHPHYYNTSPIQGFDMT